MESLGFAFKFFTRLPFPGSVNWQPEIAGRSLGALPLTGLTLGAFLAIATSLLQSLGFPDNSLLICAMLLFLEVLLGGCLFLDGFADTCDGVFSGASQAGSLEIMKDSRIGAMGAIGLILLFLFKCLLLNELILRPQLWRLLLFYPCWSKWCVSTAVFWLPGAKESGLAAFFRQSRQPKAWLLGTVFTAVMALGLLSWDGWLALLLSAGCWALTALWLQARLGGQTGDTYGFLSQISELSFLLGAGLFAFLLG